MGWPGWHVPPLGLWNFHQPVKEVKSASKIFIRCPYDCASEVRYTVNVRKFESVKKMCHPCDFASDTPMRLRLFSSSHRNRYCSSYREGHNSIASEKENE